MAEENAGRPSRSMRREDAVAEAADHEVGRQRREGALRAVRAADEQRAEGLAGDRDRGSGRWNTTCADRAISATPRATSTASATRATPRLLGRTRDGTSAVEDMPLDPRVKRDERARQVRRLRPAIRREAGGRSVGPVLLGAQGRGDSLLE